MFSKFKILYTCTKKPNISLNSYLAIIVWPPSMPFHHLGVILDQFSCFSPQLLFLWSWRHTPFWFYYMPFRYQKYAVDFYELISNKELVWILFSRFTCWNPAKTRSGCPKTCLEYYQSSQWGFGAIPRSWSPQAAYEFQSLATSALLPTCCKFSFLLRTV